MREGSNIPDAPLLAWPNGLTCTREQRREEKNNPEEKILEYIDGVNGKLPPNSNTAKL